MRTKLLLLTVTAALLFGAIANVSAQAPLTFLYQGRLTDANNQPITAATSVTFAVVSGPSGMVISLYDTVATVTPNDNGVFTIELGPMPESAFAGGKRYLAVTVGGTELLPRQLITSVPYAMSTERVPGVAYSFNYNGLAMTTTVQVVDSVVITAPCEGYVAVSASGWFSLTHTSTQSGFIRASVSTVSSTVSFNNFSYHAVGSVQPSDDYYENFAISCVFPVTQGSYTYYLNGDGGGTDATRYIRRTHLVATFFPTAYGDVDASKALSPVSGEIGPDGSAINKGDVSR